MSMCVRVCVGQVEYDGLTGHIEFNSGGQRTNYSLKILEKHPGGHREVRVHRRQGLTTVCVCWKMINLEQPSIKSIDSISSVSVALQSCKKVKCQRGSQQGQLPERGRARLIDSWLTVLRCCINNWPPRSRACSY